MKWLSLQHNNPFPATRLIGDRVFLRPPRHSDWANWAELRTESRSFLTPWEPSWPRDSLTRGAFERRIERQAREWRQGRSYNFLVFNAADDSLVGGMNFGRVLRGVSQSAMLGYWIGKRKTRQGFATEAGRLMLDYAFEELGLNRVEAATLPGNTASRALLDKLGFTEEGVMRQYLRINGIWQDHVVYSLLQSDLEK